MSPKYRNDDLDFASVVLEPMCAAVTVDDAATALAFAYSYGQIDGDHHKAWVIDQMVRALTGPNYAEFVRAYSAGEEGEHTYEWEEGIIP